MARTANIRSFGDRPSGLKVMQNLCISMLKTVLATGFFVYLVYHLASGQNGLISYLQLQKKLDETKTEHSQFQKNRDVLENKVKRLYPSSLDSDLLDEQLRLVTGKVDADEIIFFDK